MKKLIAILLPFIAITIFSLSCSKDNDNPVETRCYRCQWDIKGTTMPAKARCGTYKDYRADVEAIMAAQRAAGSSIYYSCTGQGDW